MKKNEFRNILAFAVTTILAVLLSAQAFCIPADSLVPVSDTTAKKPVESRRKNNVYRVNYYVTGSIIAVGFAGDYFAISRLKKKGNLSQAEIDVLNPSLLNTIDQWGLKQDASQRTAFAKASDYTESAIFLLPALLMIDKKIRKQWLDVLMIYVEGHTVTFTIYNYGARGPTFHNELRPLAYYPVSEYVSDDQRKSGQNRNSIYSGHTASVAFTTFFMAKVLTDFHPGMKMGTKILLYSAAFIPPAIEGYMRVRALGHFPSECMTGLVMGAALGIIVPALHKRHLKNISVGMFDVPGGMGVNLCYRIQ